MLPRKYRNINDLEKHTTNGFNSHEIPILATLKNLVSKIQYPNEFPNVIKICPNLELLHSLSSKNIQMYDLCLPANIKAHQIRRCQVLKNCLRLILKETCFTSGIKSEIPVDVY